MRFHRDLSACSLLPSTASDFPSAVPRAPLLTLRPAQGIEGVFMAMHICKHTNIYGFDVDGVQGYPYHYFDNFKGTGSAHSFKYQALFLKMLVGSTCRVASTAAHRPLLPGTSGLTWLIAVHLQRMVSDPPACLLPRYQEHIGKLHLCVPGRYSQWCNLADCKTCKVSRT